MLGIWSGKKEFLFQYERKLDGARHTERWAVVSQKIPSWGISRKIWLYSNITLLTDVQIISSSNTQFHLYRGVMLLGFPGGSVVKNSPANAGDMGLITGPARSPGEGNGNPLQYSCLRIPWTEESGGYCPWGHKRVGHNLATKTKFKKLI